MEPHSSSSSSPTFHWRYAEFDDSNFQIHGRTLFFFLVVASIIIFIILIYLYARWLCRSEDSRSSTTTTTASRLQHAPTTTRQSAPACQGLDESSFSRIPILLHQGSKGGSERECSICLGIFHDGEKVKVMPECRHCFHSECVDKWLSNRSTCPLCRSSLRVESLV